MDLNDLYSDLIYFGSSGFILSQQQLSAILASLTILQNNMKLDSVNLWGKILGLAGDYFIAEGCGDDEFGKKTYFYRFLIINLLDCEFLNLIYLFPKVYLNFV